MCLARLRANVEGDLGPSVRPAKNQKPRTVASDIDFGSHGGQRSKPAGLHAPGTQVSEADEGTLGLRRERGRDKAPQGKEGEPAWRAPETTRLSKEWRAERCGGVRESRGPWVLRTRASICFPKVGISGAVSRGDPNRILVSSRGVAFQGRGAS